MQGYPLRMRWLGGEEVLALPSIADMARHLRVSYEDLHKPIIFFAYWPVTVYGSVNGPPGELSLGMVRHPIQGRTAVELRHAGLLHHVWVGEEENNEAIEGAIARLLFMAGFNPA